MAGKLGADVYFSLTDSATLLKRRSDRRRSKGERTGRAISSCTGPEAMELW